MACDALTTGRANACFNNISGIKTMYITDDALGTVTYDATDTDVITAFSGTVVFFKFDLKGNSNTFTETITKDVSSGTLFFAQSLFLNIEY